MKSNRRILAFFCAAVLCLTLAGSIQATSGSGEVCMTAVQDNILPLTSDTMPVWSGGVLYVPYSVFDSATTGMSLGGLASVQSKLNGTVSVYNLRHMLVFDLNAGTCYDHHTGETYNSRAIIRNGRAYLPAARVCSFFGLAPPTYTKTDYGYLVRLKYSVTTKEDPRYGYALDDNQFIDAAGNLMSIRLREYNQSLRPTSSRTDPPIQTDPGQSTPVQTPDPEPTHTTIYLSFRCETGEAASEIAALLDENGMFGLFFFPSEEIGRQGSLIRRLLGQGHSVGILLEHFSDAAECSALLELGSQALETVARARTYYLLTLDSQRQSLQEEGWVCWNPGIEVSTRSDRSAYSRALAAVQAIPKGADTAQIMLDDSQAGLDALGALLRQLRGQQYTVAIPRETLA